MAKNVTGYVLDPAHHIGAPLEIPGLPGVFSVDSPVLASQIMDGLGLEHVGDVDALIAERGLPVVKVQVSEKDAEAVLASGPQQPPQPPEPPTEAEAEQLAADALDAQPAADAAAAGAGEG